MWVTQWRNFGLKSVGPSSRCTYKVGVCPPSKKVGVPTTSPLNYAWATVLTQGRAALPCVNTVARLPLQFTHKVVIIDM